MLGTAQELGVPYFNISAAGASSGSAAGATAVSQTISITTYITSGVKTWTTPPGTTTGTVYDLWVTGAGASSGGTGVGTFSVTGGGGGGTTCEYLVKGITAGTSITFIIGAAGTAPGSGTDGNNGVSSTIVIGGIAANSANAPGGIHSATVNASALLVAGGSVGSASVCDAVPNANWTAGIFQRGVSGLPGIALTITQKLGGYGGGSYWTPPTFGGTDAPGAGGYGASASSTAGNAGNDGLGRVSYLP